MIDLGAGPTGTRATLWQMFRDGPVWDGNLIGKAARSWLVENGLAERASGFNFLTGAGVDTAVALGMGERKEAEGAHGREKR